ncbi:5-hydroxytryptamine receptor 1A-like isoform X1 [Aedes albopictus]|uniref:G-protein coupled receptors family 1 profile domain-containing protein n=1 Tax=Aedes albopictus TaxID=7160 RepID=A0ABM1YQC3_AEDAL
MTDVSPPTPLPQSSDFWQLRYFLYLDLPPSSSLSSSIGSTGSNRQLYANEPDKMLSSWDLSAPVPMSENMLSNAEQTQLLLYDILIPLLGTLIIVMNVAVVTSSLLLLRKGQQPYTTYLFLGNVAASDLLTGFAVLYGQYAPKEIRGEDNCSILIGLIVSTTIVSVYSIGLIAIDRYLYIVYGLQYQRYITPSRAKLLIAATWLIGLIIGFLPAFGWRGDTDGGRVCWFVRLAPPALIILTTVVGIIPLIVVIVLYSIILHKALRRVAQLKKASREQQGALAGNLRLFRGGGGTAAAAAARAPAAAEQPLSEENRKPTKCFRCCKKRSPKTIDGRNTGKHPTKWKAIKVVMLTTGCFVVTWLPYFIASTMYVLCDPNSNPDLCRGLQFAIASPLAILGFTNSLLNPLIYAWWHNGFRTSMKKLWRKMCSCCCQPGDNKSFPQDPAQEASARTASSNGSNRAVIGTTSDVVGGNGVSQQSRSSDATTSTTTNTSSFTGSPQHRISRNNNTSNRSMPTYNSDASDLENRITDTDIDRSVQTRL